jgi:response regulator RpfG family c-di-GMP phosphodiesterase
MARWKSGPVVLFVDDDPGVLNAVRRSFRDEAIEILTAGSADEALGWIGEMPIDLIVTDQRMPEMAGTELLVEVRRRSPTTAGALLTGYPTPSTIRSGRQSGADAILSKPWDDAELVRTVRRLVGKSG